MSTTPTIDETKLGEFMGRFVGDLGATMSAALVVIGDRLGLYQAMGDGAPVAAEELASRTGTDPRYVREWLANQAAGGYVSYDPEARVFHLTPEQSLALAQEGSPAFVPGAFQLATALIKDAPKIEHAFRTGEGVGWHEHNDDLFAGTERFFRPGYSANLISSWIPALDGVRAKLEAGALVADVGCGHGASTVIMAQAFPASRFVGFDYHEPSIEAARKAAAAAGVVDRVRFVVASGTEFKEKNFDFACCFDCVHDMGDPVRVLAHIRGSLKPNGTLMIVEPFANDRLEDNLTPVGRVFYGASTMLCTPASLAQDVGLALGAQAGEARMKAVAQQAGYTHFRRASETPFNLIYEARP